MLVVGLTDWPYLHVTDKVGVATSTIYTCIVWNGSDMYVYGMSSATNQKVTEVKRGRKPVVHTGSLIDQWNKILTH